MNLFDDQNLLTHSGEIYIKEEELDFDSYFSSGISISDFSDISTEISDPIPSDDYVLKHRSRSSTRAAADTLQCLFPNCSFTTDYWCELACHESGHRTNVGNYSCSTADCGYVCSSSSVMKDHLQRCHTAVQLRCDCSSPFQDMTSFKIHMRYCPVENGKKDLKRKSGGGGRQTLCSANWTIQQRTKNGTASSSPHSIPRSRQGRRASTSTEAGSVKTTSHRYPPPPSLGSSSAPTATAATSSSFTNFRNSAAAPPSLPVKHGFLDFSQSNPTVSHQTAGGVWAPPLHRQMTTQDTRVFTSQNPFHDPISPAPSDNSTTANDRPNEDLLLSKTEPDSHDWDVTDTFSDIEDEVPDGHDGTITDAMRSNSFSLFHAAFI